MYNLTDAFTTDSGDDVPAVIKMVSAFRMKEVRNLQRVNQFLALGRGKGPTYYIVMTYMGVKASKTNHRLWLSREPKWLREEARTRYREKYEMVQQCVCSRVAVI